MHFISDVGQKYYKNCVEQQLRMSRFGDETPLQSTHITNSRVTSAKIGLHCEYCGLALKLHRDALRPPLKSRANLNRLVRRTRSIMAIDVSHAALAYTQGDNDVISFFIHASWFSPPCCAQKLPL